MKTFAYHAEVFSFGALAAEDTIAVAASVSTPLPPEYYALNE